MSIKRCLWLSPSYSSSSTLKLQPKWRIANPLTLLLLLFCLVCNGAQAEVICTGERERAQAVAHHIGQEWPLRGSDDEVSSYVQSLARRLAQALAEGRSVVWHFKVLRDRSANAFAIGNGYLYVTDGAIILARNESEVAAILAHEMGHQLAGHFCQSVQRHAASQLSGFFDWLLARQNDEVQEQAVGSLTQVIDVGKEKQADHYAVDILRAAGYDPRAMLAVARRFPGGDGLAHLQNQHRVKALEDLLTDVAARVNQDSIAFKQVKSKLAAE